MSHSMTGDEELKLCDWVIGIQWIILLSWYKKWEDFLRYKGILGLLILAWIMTLLYVPLLRAAPKVQFSIVYTNDVMGEVEPCG
jgi:hypothetical protein